MQNTDMYRYIAGLCKKRKVKMGDFAGMCGLSKSTLYRYMKGILQMNSEIENTLANTLYMDDLERKEFKRLISLSVFDGTLISSRYILDKFLFAEPRNKTGNNEIHFALYDNDSYLRNVYEIFDMILKYSTYTEFSCKLRMINCMNSDIFEATRHLLDGLLPLSDLISTEHLLMFPKKDYLECTKTLVNIIPLLKYKSYNVFYNEDCNSENSSAFLNDVIMVEISYIEEAKKEQHFFVFSFLNMGLSQCVSFDNKYMFSFFLANYENHKSHYKNSLSEAKDINTFSSFLLDLEMNNEHCLIKPNNCYNKIPISAYQSLFKRMTNDELSLLAKTLFSDFEDLQKCTDRLFSILQTRFDNAFKPGCIDVYSKNGLEQLAKNGLLTDHIDNMPPFNVDERKIIFLCLRDMLMRAPTDYKLYITDKSFFENGCIISSFRDLGILIEYNNTGTIGSYHNVFINNKMLSEIIFDYTENHIPAYHSLSSNEAIVFIDRLIEKYLGAE